jgi:hypothetical protein
MLRGFFVLSRRVRHRAGMSGTRISKPTGLAHRSERKSHVKVCASPGKSVARSYERPALRKPRAAFPAASNVAAASLAVIATVVSMSVRDNGARTIQLACFGIVRRRCNCLHVRSLSKPPPLIELEAQRAAHSRACFFVCADDALQKRASAYKALIRMVSVVLTCIAGKPPMREHPIPPAIDVLIPT